MNSFGDGVLIAYVINVRMTGYAEQWIDKNVECSDDALFWFASDIPWYAFISGA